MAQYKIYHHDPIPANIPLRQKKQPPRVAVDELPTQYSDYAYQPVARPQHVPQHVPAHHFWKRPTALSILVFIGDVILTIVPSAFILLSIWAMRIDKKPVSRDGEIVEQAAKLGPTLFPIIFAAVVSRLMRTSALWRAERGASLGIIEQLNGSLNLLAAVERAVLIPGLGVLSLGVVLLWLLSPLGGQSSLRIVRRETLETYNSTNLHYFNTSGDMQGYSAFATSSSTASAVLNINGIFYGAISSLDRAKGQDIWGNIRIPFMEYLPNYQIGDSKDGWYDFSEDDYEGPYSSLNGIVINGLETGHDTNFTMESSYFNLTCPGALYFNISNVVNGSDFMNNFDALTQWLHNDTLLLHHNVTEGLFITGDIGEKIMNSYFLDTNWNVMLDETWGMSTTRPYNVIYASQGDISLGEVAAYNCTMERSQVESDILCQGKSCQLRRIRPSQKYPSRITGWPFPSLGVTIPGNLLNWVGTSTSLKQSAQVSPIDWYVAGSNNPFEFLTGNSDYHNISSESVAQRLASLINTGYQLSLQLGATAQPPSSNETALDISQNNTLALKALGGVGYVTSKVNAMTTSRQEIIVANIIWVYVTMGVASVLLFCGFLSLWFKYAAHSPDVLGFVSSMTRDNPNFEYIPDGDMLDGLQRARLMRHVRVQFAGGDDGRIRLRNLGRPRRG